MKLYISLWNFIRPLYTYYHYCLLVVSALASVPWGPRYRESCPHCQSRRRHCWRPHTALVWSAHDGSAAQRRESASPSLWRVCRSSWRSADLSPVCIRRARLPCDDPCAGNQKRLLFLLFQQTYTDSSNTDQLPQNANISLLKYFQIAWLVWKLNARNYMCNINDNAVQGRLSENYNFNAKIYRMKYFRLEILAIKFYGNCHTGEGHMESA